MCGTTDLAGDNLTWNVKFCRTTSAGKYDNCIKRASIRQCGEHDMEHLQHTPRGANCGSSVRRCSGAVLLLAIASLLIACGGASGGSGSTVPTTPNTATLTWNAVTVAVGYNVYYGTASAPGTYAQPVYVGNITTHTLMGLSSGNTYFMVVTAVDGSSNESGPSNEVSKLIP